VHTPDSSRYWFAATYAERLAAGQPPDSFDKDFLRRWVGARCDPYRDPIPPIPPDVIAETARVYIDAYETITGERFVPVQPDTPVLDRIRANLQAYF
jgi:phosphoribosylaminoimidazole-succinocarboxamide synthase